MTNHVKPYNKMGCVRRSECADNCTEKMHSPHEKYLAQGHEHLDEPGRDSNPHSVNDSTWKSSIIVSDFLYPSFQMMQKMTWEKLPRSRRGQGSARSQMEMPRGHRS